MKFILGKKIQMSQIFDEKGKVIPVTLVEAGPCWVCQVKTKEKDGYQAIQLGFDKLDPKKAKKPEKKKPFRYLKEFRILKNKTCSLKPSDEINASVFKQGDCVRISSISKGKGFQGAVKKWGFAGKPSSHGTKHEERTLGSIGSAFPQRVVKGKKMPGRMGAERKTVKNLRIVKIDRDNNLLAIKGAVPGRGGTLLEIRG